jgi:1-acyl-sn-glycerol-3-phosphate acyltransferase
MTWLRLALGAFHVLSGSRVIARLKSVDPRDAQAFDAPIRRWAGSILRSMGVALEVDAPHGPHPRPALFAANHVSWLDTVAILAVQPAAFIAKREIAAWPVLGEMIRGLGSYYLDRADLRDLEGAAHAMTCALRAGRSVALFPEGTTSDGRRLRPFRAGGFEPALRAGVPVVPVAIEYLDRSGARAGAGAWTSETFFQSLRKVASSGGLTVRVRLGPPLSSAAPTRSALAERTAEWIARALGLQAQREPGPPGAAPAPGAAFASLAAILDREMRLREREWRGVRPDDTLDTLGIDSLAMIPLLMAIEAESGVDLLDPALGINAASTVAELAGIIAAARRP